MSEEQKIQKPEWFKPKKYNQCINFSYLQWYEELYLRRSILIELNNNDWEESTLTTQGIEYIKSEKFNHQIITMFARDEKRKRTGYDINSYNIFTEKGIIQNSLWSQSLNELYDENKVIAQQKDKSLISLTMPKDMNIQLSIGSNNFKDASKYHSIKGISVDLLEDEKELLIQFKDWVKASKEFYNIKTSDRITAASLFDWARWRIIGYYDLLIWAKQKNYKHGKYGLLEKKTIIKWLYSDIANTSSYSNEYPRKVAELKAKLSKHNIIERLYYLAVKSQCTCQTCKDFQRN